MTVKLYSGADCHLCHEAREILNRVGREVSLVVTEVDVAADPDLRSRYGDQIPVIVAGESKISKGIPDESAIRRRLLRMSQRQG